MIAADPVRLRQVLTNLVENSIKFTDRGTITMRMAADANELSIQVADTGIGIAEGELPLIWDRFYKADRVRPRNRGGTGLGLAIVRELVALHGGKIEAESQVGRGTTFTLRLPIAQAA
jgi:signal transduction histidine kinase